MTGEGTWHQALEVIRAETSQRTGSGTAAEEEEAVDPHVSITGLCKDAAGSTQVGGEAGVDAEQAEFTVVEVWGRSQHREDLDALVVLTAVTSW